MGKKRMWKQNFEGFPPRPEQHPRPWVLFWANSWRASEQRLFILGWSWGERGQIQGELGKKRTWRGTGEEMPGNCTTRQEWQLWQMNTNNRGCSDARQPRKAAEPNRDSRVNLPQCEVRTRHKHAGNKAPQRYKRGEDMAKECRK